MFELAEEAASRSLSRDSEALFRLFVDSVRDYAMFVLDPQGVVSSWNSGAERIKGYCFDEIVGQNFSKFYPPEDVAAGKCERALEVAAREGRFEEEGLRVRKDGSRFWANVVITALRDGSGALVGFAKVTRDLSAQRRAEEERLRLLALEEANRLKDEYLALEKAARRVADEARLLLTATIRSIGDAVVVADDAGRVTLMNPAAERLTGHGLSSALGCPAGKIVRLVDEAERRELQNPVERVLAGRKASEGAHSALLITQGGGEVPVSDTATAIRDDAGRVRGVIVVLRDVTAERRARLRAGFLSDASGVLAATFDYHQALEQLGELAVSRFADYFAVDLFESNAGVTRVVTRHALPGRSDTVVELEAAVSELVARAARTGASELRSEPLRAADSDREGLARELVAELLVVPFTNGPHVLGTLTFAVVASGRTFDERDRAAAEALGWRVGSAIQNARAYLAEQRAREAADLMNRAKDNFLATISHELRTPLNSVLGWAQILIRGALDPEKGKRALRTIERNARAMDRLIEDLLDVSRIIAGKLRLELAELEFGTLVEQALDSLRPAAEEKKISVSYRGAGGPLVVLGDATRLVQVISNLLNNAVKFTPEGGHVAVSLSGEDRFAVLRVKDDGQGIDPTFFPHLFNPFRQANAGGSHGVRGLGLGLAISRNLVQAHAGGIEVESRGIGQGATFTVRLPLALAKEEKARGGAPLPS